MSCINLDGSRYQHIVIFVDEMVMYLQGQGVPVWDARFLRSGSTKVVDDGVLWNCTSFNNLLACTRWSGLYNFFKLSSIEFTVASVVATISRFAVS